MSAYGAIRRTKSSTLPSTLWPLKREIDGKTHLTIHHVDLEIARTHTGLVEYLYAVFSHVLEQGDTYPQEGPISQDTFEAYFFAADVLIALCVGETQPVVYQGNETSLWLEGAKDGRSWEDCIAGFYYVKPNYPGRSSHICNAGFIVPAKYRGNGYGHALADSFLYYGPALGYKASVFNLVFSNNTASLRLWESRGFTQVGVIPRAGRLKVTGGGEEYFDAWVIYKSFELDT
ncbi:acyl-CoA N-acyltransferase [Fistulina hepatica ATCC 64428]|uniref:Acyl-CoA N-acyltransferase n=1 Tax=Fistulina hepatica ATCC 64428 TaxID=1128425 RepID=A0A0D7A9I2_9AGAR|nr:acyl-CoA N-acyltransferase [Fistulina hepatica ATCC 64428]